MINTDNNNSVTDNRDNSKDDKVNRAERGDSILVVSKLILLT